MKRRLRWLALLLSVTLSVGLCPGTVIFASENETQTDLISVEEETEAADSDWDEGTEIEVSESEDSEEMDITEADESEAGTDDSEAEVSEEPLETENAGPSQEEIDRLLDEQLYGQDGASLADYTERYGWEKIEDQQPLLQKGTPSSGGRRRARAVNRPRTINYIGIMIEFPDDVFQSNHLDDEYTLKAADMVLNGEDGEQEVLSGQRLPVLSLRKYLREYSYGALNLTGSFFPKNAAGATQSYVTPQPRGYYMPKTASNSIGYSSTREQSDREAELINGALNASKASIEQSGIQLDSNGDNYIDAITFFVEDLAFQSLQPINWGDLLWSHKTDSYSQVTIGGKHTGSYNLITTKDAGGVFSNNHGTGGTLENLRLNRAGYGVIHHEFLHTLGLPDLYRGGSDGIDPVGFYDIMAGTYSISPQGMLSLLQREWLNWGVAIPEVTTSQSITLHKRTLTDSSEVNSYKIYSPINDNEYFIVEYYKKPADPYGNHSGRGDGFIIYRVRPELGTNMGSDGSNDFIYVFRPDEESLGAGRGNLKNAVVLPTVGNSYGKALGNGNWDNDTIFYSNGQNSGIQLSVTASDADSVTLNVEIPQVAGKGTQDDPFLVSTADDWRNVVSGNRYVKLMKNIDFGGAEIPGIESFSGYLDGNGKKLSNAKVNGVGLFSMLNGGEVKDLTLVNISINGHSDIANASVGVLAGSSSATIQNVVVTGGSVNGTGGNGVGGLVGYLSGGTIDRCRVDAAVSGGQYTGGMIGLISGSPAISSSFANGTSVAGATANVGGFFGGYFFNNDRASFTNCAYDIRKTGQQKAYKAGNHDGIIGYQVPASYALDLNQTNEAKISITKKPWKQEASVPTIRFGSRATADFDTTKQVIRGISVGETTMFIDFQLGDITMTLDTLVKVTASAPPVVNRTVTFKVVNGSWADGSSSDRSVSVQDGKTLASAQIPTGMKGKSGYSKGSWNTTPSTATAIKSDVTYTYTFVADPPVYRTVRFKVVNGTWSDNSTADKTVSIQNGKTLTSAQIPTGMKGKSGYSKGSWNTTPSASTVINSDTIYTYTFKADPPVYRTVRFKVVNGTWSDNSAADKTVSIQHGKTLTSAQIPSGMKGKSGYSKGSWNATPSTSVAINSDTTYTYTFVADPPVYRTVRFKVVNGTWSDNSTADKTVSIQNGKTLTSAQIPAGMKGKSGFSKGSWNTTPSTSTAINNDTTYTYTFVADPPVYRTVRFKVVNGTWSDGSASDKTVSIQNGKTLSRAQIPTGMKGKSGYSKGSWNVTPSTSTAIKSDVTYTYTFVADPPVYRTVRFKVVNGTWSDGSASDKTVSIQHGKTLTSAQIPSGMKGKSGYSKGNWNATPSTSTAIKSDVTYTYTFVADPPVYRTVRFKVVNGTWSDGSASDKTVSIQNGKTLTNAQIPSGMKGKSGYSKGSWNVTPSTSNAIKSDVIYTYTFVADPPVYRTVHFKVVNGTWSDGSASDKTVSIQNGKTLSSAQIPTSMKGKSGYSKGSWNTTPSTSTAIKSDTTYTYTFVADPPVYRTVRFKVVNGTWSDGSASDKTVSIQNGKTLTSAQIPTGMKGKSGYSKGSWNTTPSTATAINSDTTYTYTFVADPPVYRTVRFKVVNGTWSDNSTADKTVSIQNGKTLTSAQIPTGMKGKSGYSKGSWNTTPSTSTAIKSDTTYTYTFVADPPVYRTVRFKVVNGTWSDGSASDKTVSIQNGKTLSSAQIPTGMKGKSGYSKGSWNTTPSASTVINSDTTYTYTFKADPPVYRTVRFKVVNGTWSDGSASDKTVSIQNGKTLTSAQIPSGMKGKSGYSKGNWNTTPSTATAIKSDVTYTYTFVADPPVYRTVRFKVVNGTWSDGSASDKTVSIQNGKSLTSAQIPSGMKGKSGYSKGSWNATPSTSVAINNDTTYTYTFVADPPVYRTVRFKVVNGTWSDGSASDKTVSIQNGKTLTNAQIPTGMKGKSGYSKGSWNVTPSTSTAIKSDVTYTYTFVADPPKPKDSVKVRPMYRLYNPNSGEHFYTANKNESDYLDKIGWNYEGIGWYAPQTSKTPVYRLYNPNAGDHHYTTNPNERNMLIRVGWRDEGIGWYSDDAKSVPLYRQYNPNAKTGTHNYTTNKAENDVLIRLGWRGEGIGWYGCNVKKS